MANPAEPDAFPASAVQQRIWLAHHLRPDLGLYNIAMWLPVPDGGDPERVRRALARVVARHESLRTSFAAQDPPGDGDVAVRQLVHPDLPVALARADLRAVPDPEARFAEVARADAAPPFDLARPPLWRARLVRLSGDDTRLIFVCHHAVFDGASSDIFVRELLEVYDAIGAGREPRLPELAVQYADYTVWQRDQPAPARAAADRVHRDRTQADLPADLDLPTDRPRPPVPGHRGEMHAFALSGELTARVEDWSRRHGATAFMTMLAAFGVLLSRWSGRPDVHVGCPLAARVLPELTPLIGMFVHTAVVRADLTGDPGFADTVRQVRAGVLETLDHQEIPGRTPSYQVGFNLVPSDTRGQIHNGTVLSDLGLDLNLRDGRLHGRLEYATDLFEQDTARWLADAYVTVLTAALDDPRRPVSTLPLPGRTRAGAGVRWIDGGPLPVTPRPVTELIAGHARAHPGRAAVVHDGRTVGYGELHQRATGLGGRLVELGAGPGRPVAVVLPRGADAVVAVLAALYAGAPYVALDPDGPPARNAAVLADADPAVVVARPGHAALAAGRPLVAPGERAAPPGTAEGDDAYIVYTSGSTGRPNGVVVGTAALARFVAAATARYGVTAGDRVLQFAPLHFDASVEELFVTLCAGATLVVRTERMLESVPRLLAGCAEQGVTVLDLPTAYWHEVAYTVADGATALPPGIRTVIIGGEAAAPARVAQWLAAVPAGVRLINTYGPTEATVVATAADLTAAEPEVPIGTPLPGVRAAIVDGELYLAGAGLARGYLHHPGLTAHRFVTLGGERAYRTGDLVHLRPDGQLGFAGRADEELKVSGHRVDPVGIGSALMTHSGVRDAAVLAHATASGTARLVGYVVPAAPDGTLPADLRAHLARSLPAAVVPAAFVAVPHLPRTANGKVDRAALRDHTAPTAGAPGGTELQQRVLDVWTEVLGVRPGSADDDFFELGGQSLQTIQVATRLTTALGREVTVGAVFRHPTAARLAAALAGDGGPGAGDGPPPGHGNDRQRDTVLPADVRPGPGARTAAAAGTVLLTGATGFVGRYLLRELLATTRVRVICPVRAGDPGAAADRLAHALAEAGVPGGPDVAGRVHAVPADLGRPALGLDLREFDRLAADADAVYHAAADVSLARGYASVRGANVVGTREILRLAARGRPSAVHHLSTVAVAASGGPAAGYSDSKWVAEQLVEQAARRGLPVTVYRLGRVTGPSDGTAVNPGDLIWRVLRAAVALGALPELALAEPWTPVDWVARTVLSLSRAGGTDARVRTLVPARPTRLPDVFGWVAEFGFDLPRLPVAEWAAAASRHGEHATVAVPFTAVPAVRTAAPGEPDPAGADCPAIDRALMHRYLETAIARGLLPPPAAGRRPPGGSVPVPGRRGQAGAGSISSDASRT